MNSTEPTMISDEELDAWLQKGDKWERDRSEKAQTDFRLFRERENQELRERRKEMRLGWRISALLTELNHVPVAQVLQMGNASASANAPYIPEVDEGLGFLTAQETLDLLADLKSDSNRTQRHAVEVLESALDSHKGRTRLEAGLTYDELNERLIIHYEGWEPHQVYLIEPRLGNEKAIRFIRKRFERDPNDGKMLSTTNKET
jgi:hypothetical protein